MPLLLAASISITSTNVPFLMLSQLEQLRGELRHAEEFELLVSLDGSHSNHSITDKG